MKYVFGLNLLDPLKWKRFKVSKTFFIILQPRFKFQDLETCWDTLSSQALDPSDQVWTFTLKSSFNFFEAGNDFIGDSFDFPTLLTRTPTSSKPVLGLAQFLYHDCDISVPNMQSSYPFSPGFLSSPLFCNGLLSKRARTRTEFIHVELIHGTRWTPRWRRFFATGRFACSRSAKIKTGIKFNDIYFYIWCVTRIWYLMLCAMTFHMLCNAI